MRPRVRLSVASAIVALVGATVVAAPPAGAALACGSVITQSVTLTADVGPCSGDGLVIRASNITVDLNGRRVFGRPGLGDGVGIVISGRALVTVKNGTVSHFDNGIEVISSAGITLTGLSVVDNVALPGFVGFGIMLAETRFSTLTRSILARNGPNSGLYLFARANQNVIDGNLIIDHNVAYPTDGPPVEQSDRGVIIQNSHENSFRNNQIRNSGWHGVWITTESSGNVFTKNVITGNGFHSFANPTGDGIQVGFDAVRRVPDPFPAVRNRIENNTITRNAANGVVVSNKENIVRGNVVTGNATSVHASNIAAYDLHDRNLNYTNCDSNVWASNVFTTAFPACAAQ